MNRGPRFLRTFRFHLLVAFVLAAGSRDLLAAPSRDGVWTGFAGSDLGSRAHLRPAIAFEGPPPSPRFALDDTRLAAILAGAPPEASLATGESGVMLSLPMPDGGYAEFFIAETQVMAERIQAELPGMRTYVGRSADGTTLDARFDRGPNGLHAMIRTHDQLVFVRPVESDRDGLYESYRSSSLEAPEGVTCSVADASGHILAEPAAPIAVVPSGATLSIYDIAISVTGEYTARFGGRTGAMAQIVTTINRLNGIYQPEVAIRFRLTCVAIPPTAAGDRYSTPDELDLSLLSLNTTVLNDTCGVGAYDIGHLFHRRSSGYRGVGFFATVCTDDRGRGATTGVDPASTFFMIDLLAHEIGHQFDARHVFNTAGLCADQRSPNDAYEVANGTTLMSYAISGCGEGSPGRALPFFHSHSFDQIVALRDGAAACRATSSTGNQPPTVDAGPDYTIPRATPFTLTAAGNDPDGHPITYQWEQFDLGAASPPLNGAVSGPIFRGYSPDPSPSRSFPAPFSLAFGGDLEFLPTVNRTLHFRCTVRDNRASGGGVSWDETVVTVQGEPFVVTSPNGGEVLRAGCAATVQWTVGGGGSVAHVHILLSTNGGLAFPTVLAANVPNDGSHEVQLPCATTNQARIKVEAVGNVFFDISNANLRIADDAPIATLDATGGSTGSTGEFLVPYTARVTDDCRVETGTLQVTATSLDGRATVDAPVAAVDVVTPGDVRVTGSVRVSALTGCPARVRVAIQGRDACGRTATQSDVVEIDDVTPPGISVALSDAVLWPPNHRLETIMATVSLTGGAPGSPFVLESVACDEPEDGTGDGATAPDIMGAATGTADVEFQLRAERSGGSEGRTYTIAYSATDGCGNRAAAVATVRVENDRAAPAGPAGRPARAVSGDPRPGAEAETFALPVRSGLVSVHPSPFFDATTVTFDVARAGGVSVSVHDVAGRRVRTLTAGERGAGRHTVRWDGRDDAGGAVGAGIYFVLFDTGASVEVGRAIRMRR